MNTAALHPSPQETSAPLGRVLVDQGAITPEDLRHALQLQTRIDAQLGEILLAEGLLDLDSLQEALARKHATPRIDLETAPPDPALSETLPPVFCLAHGVIPWRMQGNVLVLATARPERFERMRQNLPPDAPRVLPVLADDTLLWQHLSTAFGGDLAWQAETRVPPEMSCRDWSDTAPQRNMMIGGALLGLTISAVLAPVATLFGLTLVAMVALFLSMGLKLTAGLVHLFSPAHAEPPAPSAASPLRMPQVSVMVPLLKERAIAHALVARLSRLTYPKALLDVVLVLEEQDDVTRETLSNTRLPAWMRVVEVPAGSGLTTKPRALNYALDYCRGSIIGIWDAEDEPAVDQIEQVVLHFHHADRDVVCLQGALDYYNPRDNWLARCFTIEYAMWWRMFLPGLTQLGLTVPLGGTTLFFRRDKLHEVGGWDAHNVTEDADLGIRLARAGYRTELIPTVTMEEANCRLWPWVRQRSRWLKGFTITWAVHMRAPLQLLRDLGLRRFVGLQLFFMVALLQFLLAPVLFSFWLLPFGLSHPLEPLLGQQALMAMGVLFFLCEIVSMNLNAIAVSGPAHRHLLWWVPSMMLYFPLASIAMYKALYELLFKPFFWDKTDHGHSLN